MLKLCDGTLNVSSKPATPSQSMRTVQGASAPGSVKLTTWLSTVFGNATVSGPALTTGATFVIMIEVMYSVNPPSLSMMRALTVRGLSSSSARKLAGTVAESDDDEPA